MWHSSDSLIYGILNINDSSYGHYKYEEYFEFLK